MHALWTAVILLLGPVAGANGGRKLRKAPSRQVIYVSNALNLVPWRNHSGSGFDVRDPR